MEPELASWWYLVLAFAMGVGAYVLTHVVNKVSARGHVPKRLNEWYPEVEMAWALMVHKRRELIEAVAHAERLREKLPEEYREVIDHAVVMARAVELATFNQARRAGLVPDYWFADRDGGGPGAPLPKPVAAPDADPGVMSIDNVVSLPAPKREWIAGQLLKREAAP
jgi:hypothetical protein